MFGRSTCPRFSESRASITPGPGEYDSDKSTISRKGTSFGVGERKFSHLQTSEFAHLGPGLYSVQSGTESRVGRERSSIMPVLSMDTAAAIKKLTATWQKVFPAGTAQMKNREVCKNEMSADNIFPLSSFTRTAS